jgi:hypothetical protein
MQDEQPIDVKPGRSGADRFLAERLREREERLWVSSLVVSARIASTSFINGTGLKKWRPPKRSGRVVVAASSVMHSEDVLDTMMVDSRRMVSSAACARAFSCDSRSLRHQIAVLPSSSNVIAPEIASRLADFRGDLARDAVGGLLDTAPGLLENLSSAADDRLIAGLRGCPDRRHQPSQCYATVSSTSPVARFLSAFLNLANGAPPIRSAHLLRGSSFVGAVMT